MVFEPIRFFSRQIREKLPHLRRERDLNRLNLTRALAYLAFLADGIKWKMRSCEDFAGQPLAFTNQPKQ
jgi:hypothetical protein